MANKIDPLLQEACELLQVWVHWTQDIWNDVPQEDRREWEFQDARNCAWFIDYCQKEGLVDMKAKSDERHSTTT